MDIVTPIPFREIRRVFISVVNSHQLLLELRNIDVINKLEYDQLHIMPEDNLSELLLQMVIERKLSASALMYVLLKIDNSVLLFNSLQRYWRQSEGTSVSIARMDRIHAGIKSEVRSFFNDVKIKFLDASGCFKAPLLVLQTEQNILETRLQLAEHQNRRKMFVDKKIALLANVIDACVIILNNTEPLDKLFTDLASLVRHSTNVNLSYVVFYSRKALLRDIHYYGRNQKFNDTGMPLTDGRDMLAIAHMYASSLTPSFEMANLFFFHLLHDLWRFELEPTQEIKQSVLHLGQITLDCLNQENDEFIRTLWGSFVHLKCAFCLLGIGNNFKVIQRYIPDHHDINTATRHLMMFQKCYTPLIKNRRVDLTYHLAEARLRDLSGKLTDAYRCMKEAYGVAMQGNYREVEGVKSFYEEIKKAFKDESSGNSETDIIGDKILCMSAVDNEVIISAIDNEVVSNAISFIETNDIIHDESLFNSCDSSLFGTSETSPGLNDESKHFVIDTCKDEMLFASGNGSIFQCDSIQLQREDPEGHSTDY